MLQPDLATVLEYARAGKYTKMPVCLELLSDARTPVEAMRILMNAGKPCFMLESITDSEHWGRYTFLGCDPDMRITGLDGRVWVGGVEIPASNPREWLRGLMARHRSPVLAGMPPFTGGLVGYFAYDYIKYSEPNLRLTGANDEQFLDFELMLFNKVIVFDNFRQKMILIANISLDNPEAEYARADEELRALQGLLLHTGRLLEHTGGRLTSDFAPLFQEKEYCAIVEQAKKHIFEGDIFQIVPANRQSAGFEGSLFGTYRVLRTLNPSPYMFYFRGYDIEVAGASPETLVRLQDGVLHTFPLAGTRKRGATPEEDLALEQELLADQKELAEHNMLVDLGRNDLGKISRFGTVEVEKYHQIARFSHVMHIGSTVRGIIRPDRDALDAVDAILPAGTLSGAPKFRACEIIDRLEGRKRGIYGGAIGYLDFTGNLDTCIAIRMAYRKKDRVYVCAGAGVVADSVPANEHQECMNKAAAVIRALHMAQEMDA